jgi:hypothetical protein
MLLSSKRQELPGPFRVRENRDAHSRRTWRFGPHWGLRFAPLPGHHLPEFPWVAVALRLPVLRLARLWRCWRHFVPVLFAVAVTSRR